MSKRRHQNTDGHLGKMSLVGSYLGQARHYQLAGDDEWARLATGAAFKMLLECGCPPDWWPPFIRTVFEENWNQLEEFKHGN